MSEIRPTWHAETAETTDRLLAADGLIAQDSDEEEEDEEDEEEEQEPDEPEEDEEEDENDGYSE